MIDNEEEEEEEKDTIKKRIGRYRQYFIAGHSRWFVFIMGLSNFSLLFFNFLWIKLFFVPEFLKIELFFLPIFFISYIPFTTVFGYWDLTRGTFEAETNVSLEVNPIWIKHFKELKELREQNLLILKKIESLEDGLK